TITKSPERTSNPPLDGSTTGPGRPRRTRGALARRVWFAVWPKATAIVIGLSLWQLVVWSGWRPEYVLPAPATVFRRLGELIADGTVGSAIVTTAERAAYGFTMALAIGVVVGGAVSSSRIVRSAVGSLITGLQTMPSIAWFPLAILLFGLSERAITFVVVLGAAPSIANGVIAGIDDLSPQLLRAAHVLRARGLRLYTSVVMPAALPAYMS